MAFQATFCLWPENIQREEIGKIESKFKEDLQDKYNWV